MNQLDKIRQMAGIEVINENMGSVAHQMAAKILEVAEATAYETGAEEGNVTSDAIFNEAKKILATIDEVIGQKLQVGMDDHGEAPVGAGVDTATGGLPQTDAFDASVGQGIE